MKYILQRSNVKLTKRCIVVNLKILTYDNCHNNNRISAYKIERKYNRIRLNFVQFWTIGQFGRQLYYSWQNCNVENKQSTVLIAISYSLLLLNVYNRSNMYQLIYLERLLKFIIILGIHLLCKIVYHFRRSYKNRYLKTPSWLQTTKQGFNIQTNSSVTIIIYYIF